MKVTLTAAQLAAISAGVTLAALGFGPEVEFDNLPPGLKAGTPSQSSQPGAPGVSIETLQANIATLTGELATVKTANAQLVADLAVTRTGLDASSQALVKMSGDKAALEASLATVQTKLAATETSQADLLKLARESAARMALPLGSSAEAFATMDAPTLVLEHAKLAETFGKRFIPGGVGKSGQGGTQAAASDLAYLDMIPTGPKAKK